MWTVQTAALLLLAISTHTVLASYNCTRFGVECLGTCDSLSGACSPCNPGYEGYDCTLRTSTKNVGGCAGGNPCKNGGICYDASSIPGVSMTSCYCPYDYYGDTCHFPRVSNECFNDRMIVNVNPGKNFAGIVGLQSPTGFCDISPVNNLLTSAAPFILAAGRNRWEGYAAELPFSLDPCGGMPKVNGTTYTYEVLVQYDIMSMSPGLDELVTFSCTVAPSPAPSGRTAVLFSVTNGQGVPIENPKLGSVVTISFSVDPSSIFEDIAVKSCTVYDASRLNSREVVVNSCPVPPFARSLMKGGRGRNSLQLVMYQFSNSPILSFDCRVKVCLPLDYTCVMPTLCDAMTGLTPGMQGVAGTGSLGTALLGSEPLLGGGRTGNGSVSTGLNSGSGLNSGPLPGNTGPGNDPLSSLMSGLDLTSLTNMLATGRKKRAADTEENIVIVRGDLA